MRGSRRPALVALALLVAAVSGVAAPRARAAEWRFDPVLTGSLQYTDDPLITENSTTSETTQERIADQIARLDVSLTLVRGTPRSRLTLVGIPTIERYNEQTRLNNTQWFASTAWDWDRSERTRYSAFASYTRWERARFDFTTPGIAQPTVGGRTGYELVAGRASVDTELGVRTGLNLSLSYSSTNYLNFEVNLGDTDGDGTDDFSPVEVSTSLEAAARPAYRLSPLATAGLEVRGSKLDEGLYGKRTVLRGLVTYSYGTAERWSLAVKGGYAKSSVDDLGLFGSPDEPSAWVGNADFSRRVGHRPGGSFVLGAARDLSGSGGVLGLSLTESAYVALALPIAQFSSLRFVGNASRFEPAASTIATNPTDSYGARLEYAMAFGPHWSAVASADYQNQESDFGALSLDYYIAGLGVRWAPKSTRESVNR